MGWDSQIERLIATSEGKTAVAVEATLRHIEAGSKVRSRVDTGQMRAGFTVVMHGPHEGEVINPVEHTIYNEFGTVDMTAQPMLGPSAEEARPGFIAAMGVIFGG